MGSASPTPSTTTSSTPARKVSTVPAGLGRRFLLRAYVSGLLARFSRWMGATMGCTFKHSVLTSLDRLTRHVIHMHAKVTAMSELTDTLLAKVAQIETVGDSIIEVLGAVRQDLTDAINSADWAAVQEANDRLEAQAQEISAAITQGTVAEGEVPPAEGEVPIP